MKLKKIANTRYYKDYEFKKNLDYFDRWQENYEEKSYVLKKKQKKEDIDIYIKYTSKNREQIFEREYFNEFNEYYNYLEKIVTEP